MQTETQTQTAAAIRTFNAAVNFSEHPKKVIDLVLSEIKRSPVIWSLENVLFQFVPGSLKMIAGNLENRITVTIPANCDHYFSFLADPDLIRILSKKGTGKAEIVYKVEEDEKGQYISGTVIVNGMKYATDNAAEYPQLPELSPSEYLPRPVRSSDIATLLTFATKDQLRPAITGVNVHSELTSSDGFRLVSFPLAPGYNSDAPPFIVRPGKFWGKLPEIVHIYNEVSGLDLTRYEPRREWARIVGQEGAAVIEVFSQIIKEAYPDFKAVIPQNNEHRVTIDRATMLNKIAQIRPAANKKYPMMDITHAAGTLTLHCEDIDMGREASAQMPTTGSTMPEGYSIRFDAALLESLLKATAGQSVTFELSKPSKPVMWSDGTGAAFLIMPVIKYE